ncbi:hypothetical protein JHK82_030321 [Glycine max]|nr:hypothetical protein JHK85_030952 [Glycine max]KAG4993590.1 hypothetical protein JHK86_030417 [Glycine max]KAG5123584.1 hypothetical protein JHK82_030321 [Glycine max]KAG5145008.1 hypothetical protein JHK84_030551 [Glycine max]
MVAGTGVHMGPSVSYSVNPPLLPSATSCSWFTSGTSFDEKLTQLPSNIVRRDHQVLSFFNPSRNFAETKQWGVGIQCKCFGSMAGSVQRNPRFSKLNDDDVRYFEGILGTKNVVQDEGKLVTSNTDWMHKYKGSSKLLLQPRTADQVSQILKYCNSRNLAVVPQGGNTGLVGILSQIEPYVYEWTSERRGSISAEHGLGLMKANEIFYSKSRETVQVMASIKNMLDPNHILNPYKVLPHSLIS